MLNRLLKARPETRGAIVDPYGRVTRTFTESYAGVDVDTETTLSVPAIWRAVTMIADSAGVLPLHAYKGDTQVSPTPRLLERPNPLETRITTISAMTASVIVHGNYVAILGEPGPSGYPESIYPINPERVEIFREREEVTINGITTYRTVKKFRIDQKVYDSSEIFHVPGFTLPGEVAGIGIIAAQRQGIGAAIAVMEYASRYFDGGTMPSYIIKSKNPDLTAEEADLLKLRWMEAYGGRSRRPAVMNAETDVEPLTANANDSQLIEARTQAQADAANIVGLPGHYVGAPNSNRTYSNLETQGLEYLRWTLLPITTRIEAAFTDYLPRGTVAKFEYDGILRADTLTRYQAHQIALSNGFLTLDEVRALENRPPLTQEATL
ncbi:COG4695 Phage-related protein [uncultured Caudovirales phage]|jgi:HK97 family phage portal protein|uniref:COG4695 Phage-related protein n=1 Tax=uncultured Caudovirales phage TaxID=2100421 RepID=A0A6J5MBW3_9CAUD|nr:COG4695 Phage-related protein [uncultured Caudovirales phage]CAB4158682.1 COG4695 Phage-related protein [uncultured Caudovirales phage]